MDSIVSGECPYHCRFRSRACPGGLGGRAGVVSSLGEHTYLTLGVVFEKMYDCNKNLYDSCDQVYPEIGISFAY